MPVYQYQVRDAQGRMQQGTRSAADRSSIVDALRSEGLFIVNLKEARGRDKAEKEKSSGFSLSIGKKKIKTREMMVFCRQFASMIQAGMTVVDSLRVLQEQAEDPVFGEKLQEIATSLQKGNSLTDAFVEQGSYFPEIFINMLEAGETGGILDEVLNRMADHFERQHDLEEKIKGATTYPIVIFSVAIAVVTFLVVVVLPTFAGIFDQMGAEMPLITRALLAVSGFLTKFWYLVLLGIGLMLFGLWQYVHTEGGRLVLDRLRFRIPIYGSIYQKAMVARFSRTLGALLASGVEILKSIELVGRVTGNIIIENTLRETRDMIRQGQRLAEPLRESSLFPPMMVAMTAIGEESGSLDQMLGKLADFYEAEVEYVVNRLSSILEPILIIFLGGVVALIVISIVMPMFSMYQHVV